MTERRERDELLPGPGDGVQRAYGSSPKPRKSYQRQGVGEAVLKALIRSLASSLGRIIVRFARNRMR